MSGPLRFDDSLPLPPLYVIGFRPMVEIDIVKEVQLQQIARRQGYKFCSKCGKAHGLPKGLENIGSNNVISLKCGCGGTVVMTKKEEDVTKT